VTTPLFESSITSLKLLNKGKVRDIYAVDADKLLIVTSDRLSAFDVILPDPIPRKGEVLTAVADFWFEKLGHIVPNQLTGIDPESVVAKNEREQVRGRSVVVKRLKPLPIEAVVRGYVIGSGWKDYQETGAICGIALPAGLKMAQKLPSPIFTPATKAEVGDHDENVSYEQAAGPTVTPPWLTPSKAPARPAPSSVPKPAMPPSVSTKKPPFSPRHAASSSPIPSSNSASTPPAPCT
jgi:phosphoribosylaminoimidazole-succinocarboxamide synthase